MADAVFRVFTAVEVGGVLAWCRWQIVRMSGFTARALCLVTVSGPVDNAETDMILPIKERPNYRFTLPDRTCFVCHRVRLN